MEEWRPIDSTGGAYQASNLGRIRKADTLRIRSIPAQTTLTYHRVCLKFGERWRSENVHVLVAAAFLGPRPEGHEINHKNGNSLDNRAENLEYLTKRDHSRHTYEVLGRPHGPKGEDHGHALLTNEQAREVHRLYSSGEFTMRELAERFGIVLTAVSGIVNGYNWKHLGLGKAPKRDYHLRGLANPKGKVSPEMKEQIRRLHAEGRSGHQIAHHLGLGSTTVYRVLND